jgi:hypothetical protein
LKCGDIRNLLQVEGGEEAREEKEERKQGRRRKSRRDASCTSAATAYSASLTCGSAAGVGMDGLFCVAAL